MADIAGVWVMGPSPGSRSRAQKLKLLSQH